MSCPCKTKLTEEQKALINGQNGKSFVQNTSVSNAEKTSTAISDTFKKVGGIIGAFNGNTPADLAYKNALQAAGIDFNKLNGISADLDKLQSSVTAFKNQATYLTNPQNLMAVVGKMNFAGSLGCALGIEGLDVNLSIDVIGGKGINAINVAGSVNADLDKLLSNLEKDPTTGAILNSSGLQSVLSGIDNVTKKMNDALNAVNNITNASVTSIKNASSLITNYSQINFFSNLLGDASDPCNKASVSFATDSILTDEFKRMSGAANRSLSTGGFG